MVQPKPEPLWHIEIAIVCAIALQLLLSNQLTVGPKYLIAGLELLLVVGLRLTEEPTPRPHKWRRRAAIFLTALISFANITSLVLVCRYLIKGSHDITGTKLLVSAVAIYLTNIIIFGLWYWQMDGGGAGNRGTHQPPIDFLYPQMGSDPDVTEQPGWRPSFFDYLYVSVTNATAFSPTDAMPLTHRAKLLMTIQGLVSLSTVALVAARAINILG
jgi:uncharacterized membrane protein